MIKRHQYNRLACQLIVVRSPNLFNEPSWVTRQHRASQYRQVWAEATIPALLSALNHPEERLHGAMVSCAPPARALKALYVIVQ